MDIAIHVPRSRYTGDEDKPYGQADALLAPSNFFQP